MGLASFSRFGHKRGVRTAALAAALAAALTARAAPVTLVFVGTTDVHGHLQAVEEQLPGGRAARGGEALLGGYLKNLRNAHPGRVVLVDSGDMMQGTLASNLGEGAAVVKAMNQLGYAAAAVGNHEFDFGPVGPRTIAQAGDDPRGALKARVAEARFPWLTCNVVEAASGEPVAAPLVRAFTVVEAGGIKVGIVGATSEDLFRTTHVGNLGGLRVEPLAPSVARAARAARAAGAEVVVLAVHAGGECKRFDAPDDLASCLADTEVFALARALPRGTVDAIFAGHSHQGVAAVVNGIPIAQSFSYNVAFSRIDLTVDGGRVVAAKVHPPTELCEAVDDLAGTCDPHRARGRRLVPAAYEGAPVRADATVERAFAPDLAQAEALRNQPIGVKLPTALTRAHRAESPLGNFVADVIRDAVPCADLGLTNGGGLRDDLPAGDLTYGALFDALPFDNRIATMKLDGRTLRRLIETNVAGAKGILSLSGMRVAATCEGPSLRVKIARDDGRALDDKAVYTVATTDFLARGGDDFGPIADRLPRGTVSIDDQGPPLRVVVAGWLRRRGRAPAANDPSVFDPAHPRIALPRARPFRCE